MMHWHLHAGLSGCLPNYSEVYETVEDAHEALREYCEGSDESCTWDSGQVIVSRNVSYVIADSVPLCGWEYAEIYPCSDDCEVNDEGF